MDEVAERDELPGDRDVCIDGRRRDRDGIAEPLDVQATTAPRRPSRRRSGALSASGCHRRSAANSRRARLRTARPRSRRWNPPRVRRPTHWRSRRFRSSSEGRRSGRCPGCRTGDSSHRRAEARGCRGSPGTPCPRSRCRRCWCAQRSGWDPGRNAAPRRRLRPAARVDAASPRRDRARFGSPDPNRRQSRPHRAWRAGATRPNPDPRSSLPGLPASVASAMECGNHASGPWPTPTFPLI